ncbi:MAG: hypothetical protein LBM27_02305 [Lactobacillaceae bacterium]|jgi:hypothetical protein|nr:hypothetical protein [Lactobacillaceae bacterium]
MDELFITIGSQKYLRAVLLENPDTRAIPMSGNATQTAVLSWEDLKGSVNPVRFGVIDRYIQAPEGKRARSYMFTYMTGEEKDAENLDKLLLNDSTQDLKNANPLSVTFMKEKDDLHRYVLFTSWEDINDMQHFKGSPLLAKITSNFYSTFNVIYTRGFD